MITIKTTTQKIEKGIKAALGSRNKIQKAFDGAMNDVRTALNKKIAKTVSGIYNVSEQDVREIGNEAKKTQESIGSTQIKGIQLHGLRLVYRGRRLTPPGLSMNIVDREDKKIRVYAEILRGQRKMIKGKYETPIFFAPQKQGVLLPWQRVGKKKLPVYAIKTVSIPQMIENKEASKIIDEEKTKLILEKFPKRMEARVEKSFGIKSKKSKKKSTKVKSTKVKATKRKAQKEG